MKGLLAAVGALLTVSALVTVQPSPVVADEPDPPRTIVVTPADPDRDWRGDELPTAFVDLGASSNPRLGEPCETRPGSLGTYTRYCDVTLVHVDVEPSYWATRDGGLRVALSLDADSDGVAPDDVHGYVWKSDAAGNRDGAPLGGHPGLQPARPELAVVVPEASGYYRVDVVYARARSGESPYRGELSLRTRTTSGPPDSESLPPAATGARPGPDVLYADAPRAPQLDNRHPRFQAAPLMVSGTEAYVDGEYLYQDYLYDDWGANAAGGVDEQACLTPDKHKGDLTYPADAKYGNNAADLVEFRIDVDATSVAYRITLNTLLEPDTTIAAIAFDAEPGRGGDRLPVDPGAPFPGTDEVVTTWGTGARFDSWTGAAWDEPSFLESHYDIDANQITVVVPRGLSDPRGVRNVTVAVGLRDPLTNGWVLPAGAASGIYNLGLRFDEPVSRCNFPPDTNQAEALAPQNDNPTRYAHPIDFDKLDAGVTESTVPSAGYQMRIYASRLKLGEGRSMTAWPSMLGQLQPYSLYVPTRTPAGLTLGFHGSNSPGWQFNGFTMVDVFGEERSHLVAMPNGRIQEGNPSDPWWRNEAEYDVFEVWNDVARHFSFPPDQVTIMGGSGGGYGAYRLGMLWPDLFGKAVTLLGPPAELGWLPPLPPPGVSPEKGLAPQSLTNMWLENARNLPFMNVVIATDELVPFPGPRAQNLGAPEFQIKGFNDHRYRFRFLVFDGGEHLGLNVLVPAPTAAGSLYMPPAIADFLGGPGESEATRDPSHVTFAYVPATDDPDLGLVHNHAHWVSDVDLANEQWTHPLPPAKGLIDVVSHATGKGDPPSVGGDATGLQTSRCTLGAGSDCGVVPYNEYRRDWGAAPDLPRSNALTITMTNLEAVTIDARDAGLDLCETVTLSADAHFDPLSGLTEEPEHVALKLSGLRPSAVTGAAGFEQKPDGLVLKLAPGHSSVSISPVCGKGGPLVRQADASGT